MRDLRVLEQDAPNRWAWRSGPTTPAPFLSATRRLEWLAFAATPIGGYVAVVDRGSAGGMASLIFLIAVAFALMWAMRELYFRLPEPASIAFVRSGVVLFGLFVLGVVALIFYASPVGALGVLAFWTIVVGVDLVIERRRR